jgi:pimeloyl-ACP methyl ester carboxylesterase
MLVSLRSDIFLQAVETPSAVSDIWFVHGFGESGLSFHEALSSPLAAAHNLYVPDLPGFGVSPPDPDVRSIASAAGVLISLIGKVSGSKPVVLVGHSLGALVAIEAAERLGSQVGLLVNVEGNLTDGDTYLSGLTSQYSPGDFYAALTGHVAAFSGDREALLRYRTSLRLADTETLWHFGKSGVEATGTARGAESFLGLTCRRSYYWGGESLSPKSLDLLRNWPATIGKREFPDAGHWLMITRTRQFYATLAEDIAAARLEPFH